MDPFQVSQKIATLSQRPGRRLDRRYGPCPGGDSGADLYRRLCHPPPRLAARVGGALSVHIYDLALNVPGGSGPAAATAIVLMALLIGLNVAARYLARRWQTR
jgi:hypothetical protein